MLAGGLLSGLLGGLSAYSGARSRMTLALLAELAFGRWALPAVKLLIAAALIGWFGVIVSACGGTASKALAAAAGVTVAPYVFSIPLTVAIAVVTLRGVQGLEKLGQVIVPLTAVLLALSIGLVLHRGGPAAAHVAGGLSFSAAVSAITGSYIVGIVIQPDYGRFVRRPLAAGLAAGLALGAAYPAILILSSIPPVALGKSDLITAMIALGVGAPALGILLLGAWIDASACLYSGSLSLTNQFPRLHLAQVVVAAAVLGAISALAHAERHFLGFLEALGLILPPLAAAQITRALSTPRAGLTLEALEGGPALRLAPAGAVLAEVAVGVAESRGWISLSGLATLDSVCVSGALTGLAALLGRRKAVSAAQSGVTGLRRRSPRRSRPAPVRR